MTTSNLGILKPEELKQVESYVPTIQSRIHFSFKATVIDEYDRKYNDSIVILSEHMITICCRGFFGWGYSLLRNFHIFDIVSVNVFQDDSVELNISENDNSTYTIVSDNVIQFTRYLIRNYLLSNPNLPAEYRFKFQTNNPDHFPPLIIKLSPSQEFQTTYNGYCSYYGTSYFHSVPLYFHNNIIKTGTCIFNLNELPLHLIEHGLDKNKYEDTMINDIRPITVALSNSPYVFGLNCEDLSRSDIILGIAPFVMFSKNLRILRLVKCGFDSSFTELANAMRQAKYGEVEYWDFSDNNIGSNFNDVNNFFESLQFYDQGSIRALKFNNCNLQDTTITLFLNSIVENNSCQKLEVLEIKGSKMNIQRCEDFNQVLLSLPNNRLQKLALGPLESPSYIFSGLLDFSLKSLSIVSTSFNDEYTNSFISYLNQAQSLDNLDLCGSSLSSANLIKILSSFIQRPNIKRGQLYLGLSNMYINNQKLHEVFNFLLDKGTISTNNDSNQEETTIYTFEKIGEIDLNENGINSNEDADFLFCSLKEFRYIRKISLARNFSSKNVKDIGVKIGEFMLSIPSLKSLNISGNHKNLTLLNETSNVLKSLSNNPYLEEIDISNNLGGDEAYRMLINVLKINTTLHSINIDGNTPKDLNSSILSLLDICCQLKTLLNFHFVVEDTYSLLSELEGDVKNHSFELIEYYRTLVKKNVQNNCAEHGIFGELSFLNDETLNKIIDESTLDMHLNLHNIKIDDHYRIAELLDIPYPYESNPHINETTANTNLNIQSNYQNGTVVNTNLYGDDSMNEVIHEPSLSPLNIEPDQTIQFKSLCKRKPNFQTMYTQLIDEEEDSIEEEQENEPRAF